MAGARVRMGPRDEAYHPRPKLDQEVLAQELQERQVLQRRVLSSKLLGNQRQGQIFLFLILFTSLREEQTRHGRPRFGAHEPRLEDSFHNRTGSDADRQTIWDRNGKWLGHKLLISPFRVSSGGPGASKRAPSRPRHVHVSS